MKIKIEPWQILMPLTVAQIAWAFYLQVSLGFLVLGICVFATGIYYLIDKYVAIR